MARTNQLPPPPERPLLSPPAWVPGEAPITVPGLPGEPSLEGALRVPANPERAVVLCHPHPLYGGTMHSAVVLAVAKVLEEVAGERTACLRFNYRGVGTSEGAYDEGKGETLDVRAAIDLVRDRVPGKPITVCGYSFGTGVAFRAVAAESDRSSDIDRVVLIAPAVRLFSFLKEDAAKVRSRAPVAMFVGDDDEFCDVAEAEALARTIGATLEVLPQSDHYFLRSRRKLAERVVPALLS